MTSAPGGADDNLEAAMPTTIVFVHGRGQEAKNPANLLRDWRGGLAAGLVRAQLPPADAVPAVFPYYGDILFRMTAEMAAAGGRVQLEAPMPDDPEEIPFQPYVTAEVGDLQRQLVTDMAVAAGAVPPEGPEALLSWKWARKMLGFLSKHTRVDRQIIQTYLRDVAVYLERGRDTVLQSVRAALPPDGDLVIVAHSLGGVVARDLLETESIRRRTKLWVTAGAPLGLETVQRNLLSKGCHNPGLPWLTAYDVNDIVALGHPLREQWGAPLDDVEVDNGDAPHSITQYLGHGRVAEAIGRAVR